MNLRERLCLSTIDDQAQNLAARYGLKLEIAEYSTAWNLDREFPQTSAVVAEKLKKAPAAVLHGPYSELFPCAVDPRVREVAAYRFRQTIRLAQNYGIHKIVLHGGFNPWLYFDCWFAEQSVLFWEKFAEEIPEGMVICLENVLEKTPEMLGNIIRSVRSERLRMCLDIGHANAYSKVPVQDWIKSCGDILEHFHVHNNDGTRDSHSPLSEGTVPMPEILTEIKNTCPKASITLELMDGESSLQWLEGQGFLEAV